MSTTFDIEYVTFSEMVYVHQEVAENTFEKFPNMPDWGKFDIHIIHVC